MNTFIKCISGDLVQKGCHLLRQAKPTNLTSRLNVMSHCNLFTITTQHGKFYRAYLVKEFLTNLENKFDYYNY